MRRCRSASAAAIAALVAAVSVAGCGTTTHGGQPATGATGGGGPSGGSLSGPVGALARPGGPASGSVPAPASGAGTTSGAGGGAVPGLGTVPGTTGGTTGPTATTVGGHPLGPLSIGVLYSNNTAAQQALGVNESTSLTPDAVAKALVTYYNSHGGLAGRKLDPIYSVYGAEDPNYETDFQAACASFTQDHHVAAVLDIAGAWSENFQQCLTNAHAPYLGGAVFDNQDLGRFPGIVNPSDLSIDSREIAVLQTLNRTGYLKPSNRLGVIYEDCPDIARVYKGTFTSVAAELKLNVAGVFAASCITGFGGAGQGASEMQQAVLRFKSNNVDRVTFISHYESALILVFGRAAQNDNYYPGYALSSQSGAEGWASGSGAFPSQQARNINGVGWQPFSDLGTTSAVSQAGQTCLQILAGEGVHASGTSDYGIAYSGCEVFFLLGTLLTASNGVSDFTTMLADIHGLGSRYQSVIALNGATYIDADRRDGAAAIAPFAYVGSCGCIHYNAPATRFVQ